jgi:serine/threonine protein kinase
MKEFKSQYIVRYYGNYFFKNRIWIVMELADEGSVTDLIAEHGTLKEDQIKIICKSVLGGLAYMHDLKIVHRDIKPGNLLLTTRGECKLADFGISTVMSGGQTRMQTMIGTPYFLAPEVISGSQGYTAKVDVWALGITTIQMAEGKPPYFDINPMRALFLISQNEPPRLHKPSRWSKLLVDFLDNALCKDQFARPTSASMLRHPFVADAADRLDLNNGASGGSGVAAPADDDDDDDVVADIAEQERKEMEEWLAKQKALEENEKSRRKGSEPPQELDQWVAEQEAVAVRAKTESKERRRERKKESGARKEKKRTKKTKVKHDAADGSKPPELPPQSETVSPPRSPSPTPVASGSNNSNNGHDAAPSAVPDHVAPRPASLSSHSDSDRVQQAVSSASSGSGSSAGSAASGDNVCAQCSQPIAGNHLKALNRKYHIEHFVCSMCSMSLVGKPFTSAKQGTQISCVPCHEKVRAARKSRGASGLAESAAPTAVDSPLVERRQVGDSRIGAPTAANPAPTATTPAVAPTPTATPANNNRSTVTTSGGGSAAKAAAPPVATAPAATAPPPATAAAAPPATTASDEAAINCGGCGQADQLGSLPESRCGTVAPRLLRVQCVQAGAGARQLSRERGPYVLPTAL